MKNTKIYRLSNHGFTLIELMVTVAVIGILATITIPSYLIHTQRKEVVSVIKKTEYIRENINRYYSSSLEFPANNKEAGIPQPEQLIGNRITGIKIDDGVIHIALGNKASKRLQGKTISIRPAVVTGSPASPISWLCGYDKAVEGMKAIGKNNTDVPTAIMPMSCIN